MTVPKISPIYQAASGQGQDAHAAMSLMSLLYPDWPQLLEQEPFTQLVTFHPPKRSRKAPLSEAVRSLISTCSDVEVSRRTGVPVQRIKAEREAMGKPKSPHWQPVPEGLVECFGRMTDQEVADRFGKALVWVRKLRNKMQIRAYDPGLELQKALLEKHPQIRELLGTVSDRSLAKQFGGTPYTYRMMREQTGIEPYNKTDDEEAALWRAQRHEAEALLGKVSDTELSRRYGGHPCRYAYLRNKAGIAAYTPGTTPT